MKRNQIINQIIKYQQLLYYIQRETCQKFDCECVCVCSVGFRSFARAKSLPKQKLVHSVVLVVDGRGQGMIRMNDEPHDGNDNGDDDNDTRVLNDDADDSVLVLDDGMVGGGDMFQSSFDRIISNMLLLSLVVSQQNSYSYS